jgi:hypothetical protein
VLVNRSLRPLLLQQRLRLLQIARAVALREPPVHRSQQVARLLRLKTSSPTLLGPIPEAENQLRIPWSDELPPQDR